jgi:hypothetical protein
MLSVGCEAEMGSDAGHTEVHFSRNVEWGLTSCNLPQPKTACLRVSGCPFQSPLAWEAQPHALTQAPTQANSDPVIKDVVLLEHPSGNMVATGLCEARIGLRILFAATCG